MVPGGQIHISASPLSVVEQILGYIGNFMIATAIKRFQVPPMKGDIPEKVLMFFTVYCTNKLMKRTFILSFRLIDLMH